MNYLQKLKALCRMIKIEHSIFALPFAWLGLFSAAGGRPDLKTLTLLSLAMIAGRSFAMTANRIADLRYDAANPRTAGRPLVTGEISVTQAKIFAAGSAILLLLFSALLNAPCFWLGALVLALSLLYSYAKRFTWLCHFILGAVLGLAPLAGWLASGQVFTAPPPIALASTTLAPSALAFLPPLLLSLAVMFWVAGFDVIYACQDIRFDQEHKLFSMPARFGLDRALGLAAAFHANTVLFLLLGGWLLGLGFSWHAALLLVAALLFRQHRMVSPSDLSRVNAAFFTLNAAVSPLIFIGALFSL